MKGIEFEERDPAMKRLIINADDFGLTPGINRAVLKAFRDGVLTSTTLMVNAPSFPEAVSIARANPRLGVGVHLNILRGRPVLPPGEVRSLVDASGSFLKSTTRLIRRWTLGRIDPREVCAEFGAQIRRAKDAGLSPTHLDSERHLHSIFFVVAAAAGSEHGIRKLRLCGEISPFSPSTALSPSSLKTLLLLILSRFNRREAVLRDIASPDHFFGVRYSCRMDLAHLVEIISSLPDGNSEIMCHPGYVKKEIESLREKFGIYRILESPEEELIALLSPRIRSTIEAQKIELINYGNL